MFEVYSYNIDERLYGIRIRKEEIKLGSINKINSFSFIKYHENLDDDYHSISFDGYFDLILLNHLCEIMNCVHIEDNSLAISDILFTIKSIFSTKRKENILNEYLGLMCELFLIYKMQLHNLDLIKYFQVDKETYDINFKNGSIEIKYMNKINKTVHLNTEQLINIYKKNVEIACINFIKDQTNGLNLNELFDKINFSDHFKKEQIKHKIDKLFYENEDIFKEWKIDVKVSEIFILDKSYLPGPEIIQEIYNSKSFVNADFNFKVIEEKNNLIDVVERLINENL